MKIVIPSYKRPEHQTTYNLLERIGAPMEDVYIFVQNQDDYVEYSRRYSNVIFLEEKHNVSGNRNNCLNFFKQGEHLVMIDDDVKWFGSLCELEGKCKIKKIEDWETLRAVFENGFNLCIKEKTVLFGVNMTENALFMNNKIVKNGFVGILLGIINSDLRFDENLDMLEDTDFCCQVRNKYSSIIRMNGYCCSPSRKINGGQKERYENGELNGALKKVILKWNNLISVNLKNKNNMISFKK